MALDPYFNIMQDNNLFLKIFKNLILIFETTLIFAITLDSYWSAYVMPESLRHWIPLSHLATIFEKQKLSLETWTIIGPCLPDNNLLQGFQERSPLASHFW